MVVLNDPLNEQNKHFISVKIHPPRHHNRNEAWNNKGRDDATERMANDDRLKWIFQLDQNSARN